MNNNSNDFLLDPQGTGNNLLSNYILDFYKTKYKFMGIYQGPTLSADLSANLVKMLNDTSNSSYIDKANNFDSENFAKKRACCLNNPKIPFSLPSYDISNHKIVTTTLKIPIFNNQNDITKQNCTFGGSKFDHLGPGDSGHTKATDACNNFYPNFCNIILEDRKGKYQNSAIYNGPYQNNSGIINQNPYSNINPFPDCNCQNSAFMQNNIEVPSATLDKAVYAQTLDQNCSTILSTSDAYYPSWVQEAMLCINSINISGKVTAIDSGIININQKSNCIATTPAAAGAGATTPGAGATTPGATTPGAGTQPQTQVKPSVSSDITQESIMTFLNDELIAGFPNKYLIIVIVLLFIILIFMFSGGRRRRYYDND